jgi:hypothetical protein
MSPRFLLPLTLFLFVFNVSAAAAADEQLPAVSKHLSFTLTALGSNFREPEFKGTLDFHEGYAKWKPAAREDFSFAKLWKMSGQWKHDEQELKLVLQFECLGPKNPERRLCLDTRVLDKDGKLLAHDWQVESDGRIQPADEQSIGLKFLRSRLNFPDNTLPRWAIAQAARLDIRLVEYPDGLPPHFPSGPHNLDLAITRPNRCGDFDVTFTNPPGWDLDPPKHQIAFQVFVYDADKKFIRADRRFLVYRADGNYRQQVRVEPKYFDQSRVSISVYTRQPDNDKFIRDFFYGGSSGYRGCWTGDGGELVELPIRGDKLFPDLPELAALQTPAGSSR